MTDAPRIAQPLRIVWGALCAGAALAVAGAGWLAVQAEASPLAERAEGAFYVVALLGVAGLAAAFFLVHRMEERLVRATSEAEAERTVALYGVAALAAAEVPALAAATAAVLTGDLLVLAFGAPLFAFAALTWPGDDRVARWLGPAQRASGAALR